MLDFKSRIFELYKPYTVGSSRISTKDPRLHPIKMNLFKAKIWNLKRKLSSSKSAKPAKIAIRLQAMGFIVRGRTLNFSQQLINSEKMNLKGVDNYAGPNQTVWFMLSYWIKVSEALILDCTVVFIHWSTTSMHCGVRESLIEIRLAKSMWYFGLPKRSERETIFLDDTRLVNLRQNITY